MAVTTYARTLVEIVERTQRLCGDYVQTGSDGRIWSWAEVQRTVNDFLLDLVDSTGLIKDVALIRLVDGQNVYDLPADCIRLLRVGMHGADGYVVLPTSMTEVDLTGCNRLSEGDPTKFFREFLLPNQIGVLPIPYETGSTTTMSSNYGLLRRVVDSDGEDLTYDAEYALRRVEGGRFTRSGTGEITRSLVADYGNLQVHFVRAPSFMQRPDDYPDSDIPEWIHPDLAYGVAAMLLKSMHDSLSTLKAKRFQSKWMMCRAALVRRCEYLGPLMRESVPV